MRVLALSPGPVQDQLDRLPALAAVAEELGAMVQVACDPTCREAWELLPGFDKVIPINFESIQPWRTGRTFWAASANRTSRPVSTSRTVSRSI